MLRFLQRIGLAHTPDWKGRTYEFVVFLMSEGTAQGTPRPLEVKRFRKTFELDLNDRFCPSFDSFCNATIQGLLRNGLETTMPNGMPVRYAPRTIYKVTHEVVSEDA